MPMAHNIEASSLMTFDACASAPISQTASVLLGVARCLVSTDRLTFAKRETFNHHRRSTNLSTRRPFRESNVDLETGLQLRLGRDGEHVGKWCIAAHLYYSAARPRGARLLRRVA